ncbi:hypothetical protein GF367_01530 [Candidatus Woesearchaeota archaeon]|nr:hypothetical protein [Candidatus Woesearchaeota archaeon]
MKTLCCYLVFLCSVAAAAQEVIVDTLVNVDALTAVNSPAEDFSLVTLGDTAMLFSSDRGQLGSRPDYANQEWFEAVWLSRKEGAGWSRPEPVRFRDGSIEYSLAGYSDNGEWFIVYDGGLRGGDLFMAKRKGCLPRRPRRLSLDDRGSHESSGFFLADRGELYFTSDREGGLGGLDVWVATLDERLRVTAVEHVGSGVNTGLHEHSLWIRHDTLWFSSQGHGSQGGFDVFYSVRSGGKWSEPVTLGAAVNSGGDDINYSPEGKLCSNRGGDYDIFSCSFEYDSTVIEEDYYYMVQLITLSASWPSCVPPVEFKEWFGIEDYPVTWVDVVVDGDSCKSYLLDKEFSGDDGLEKCFAYKEGFISDHPLFGDLPEPPFVNAYTMDDRRKMIHFDGQRSMVVEE